MQYGLQCNGARVLPLSQRVIATRIALQLCLYTGIRNGRALCKYLIKKSGGNQGNFQVLFHMGLVIQDFGRP